MADVSVVIPCYNGEAFIEQTLASVIAQTDQPGEVLVIDDGSTDGSAAVVEAFIERHAGAGPRIELMTQANAGESSARNAGVTRARGRYIAFLDADDVWMPGKTAAQIALLESQPDAVAAHSRIFNFRRQIEDLNREETEPTRDDPSVEDLLLHHYVNISSTMVRAEVLGDGGGVCFAEDVQHSEDMIFLAGLRLKGRLRAVDELLVAKRVHDQQQTRKPWHPIWSLETRVHWYREHAEAIGQEVVDRLEHACGWGMVRTLEARYWERQVDGLAEARDRVRALFPELLGRRPIASRRIYPRWVYRLRDLLGGRGSADAGTGSG